MGFYFARFADLNVFRLGQLWTVFQQDYPKASTLPFIVDPNSASPERFEIDAMPVRAVFTNVDDSGLVQIQNSAFLRNWRKTRLNSSYTHYADLKPIFNRDWQRFTEFLDRVGLPPPQVFQTEVTYVNHLVRGEDWNSYNDVSLLIKPIAPRKGVATDGRIYSFLPEASTFGLNIGYNLPDVALQVSTHSAITQPDGIEVIQMTVTAKKPASSETDTSLWEALDRCHEAVILGFDDVTTELAHGKWGKL